MDKIEPVKNISVEYRVGTVTICNWNKNRNKMEEFCMKSSFK